MEKKTFQVIFLMLSIALLHGCALVDKHLFNPAASHARIDPLFRTADCKDYVAPNGEHWLKSLFSSSSSTRNLSSIFVKDICEHQTLSVNEEKSDKVYLELCSSENGMFINTQTGVQNCINYLVRKSDEICNLHKSHIYGDRTAMNTLLGTLALGAGVAGTMTGAGVAHYLAGSAGFLTGGQALMNNEIYRNFVTNAILLEIDNNRKDFLKTISYLNDTSNNATVGLGKVQGDAIKYHNMCSFYDGLASLLNKSGDKSDIASKVIAKQFIAKKKLLDGEIKELETKITNASDADKTTLNDALTSKKKEYRQIIEIIAVFDEEALTSKTDEKKSQTEKL